MIHPHQHEGFWECPQVWKPSWINPDTIIGTLEWVLQFINILHLVSKEISFSRWTRNAREGRRKHWNVTFRTSTITKQCVAHHQNHHHHYHDLFSQLPKLCSEKGAWFCSWWLLFRKIIHIHDFSTMLHMYPHCPAIFRNTIWKSIPYFVEYKLVAS